MKTIAHEFLDIEKQGFDVSQESYDTLGKILEKAKEKIDYQPQKNILTKIGVHDKPRKIMHTIDDILGIKNAQGEFIVEENDLLLSQVLEEEKRKLDCRSYPILVYSMGEELGLHLELVLAPEQVFLRWDDGKNVFNWDTGKDPETNDEFYIDRYNISKKSILNGVYLNNLTRDEIISLAYSQCGIVMLDNENLDGAISYFDKAIGLNPKSVEAHNNRGIVEKKIGKPEDAIVYFDKAINLDSYYEGAYINRGIAKKDIGDSEGAEKDVKIAERLKYQKETPLVRNLGNI